jgi:hypothetical protein
MPQRRGRLARFGYEHEQDWMNLPQLGQTRWRRRHSSAFL